MVGIFTGAGAGAVRSSANILGGLGLLGGTALGRHGESVSVNAANGNLLISQQDEFLVGRGLDIGISRAYNSLADTTDGDNGDQWQFSTQRRVFGQTGTLNQAGSTIKQQSGDGSVITYEWKAAIGAYLTTDGDGAHDTLSNTAGVWTWTEGSSHIKESYSAYGSDNWRITAQTDADNQSVSFTYSGDKLDKVTTVDGSWIQYSWLGNNVTQIVTGYTDLITASAKTSTSTRYSYDASNRLIQVITDLSPDDNAIADGKTYITTYTYDGASKRVASIGQTDGSSLAITYDGSGRVLTLTQMVASGDTRVTLLSYGTNYTNVTGPDGQVTRLDYDAAKQLTKITAPPAYSGAAAQTVQFGYDGAGNVTSVTDAKGGVSNFIFDGNGNNLTATDAIGQVVTRTFDTNNNKLTETRTASDGNGGSQLMTTRYAYDSRNHLRFVVSGKGNVTEYYYDGYGQMYWSVEYPQAYYDVSTLGTTTALTEAQLVAWRNGFDNKYSQIVQTSYDSRGNLTGAFEYGRAGTAWGNGDTSEGQGVTYYTYDQAGRLLATSKQGEAAQTFVYDGMDRLVASTDAAGGTTTIVFNDGALTTTVTTAPGYVTTSTYNKAGELISKVGSGNFDVGSTWSYKYDKNGRIRQATDATGYNTYFLYDKAGRKIAEINHYGEIVEYRYDANNNIIATTCFTNVLTAGQIATLGDPNSVVEMSSIRPAAHSYDIWSWNVYDAAGRVVQSIDGDGGVTDFAYDASNQLVKTTSYYNKVSVATLKSTPPLTVVGVAANAAKDRISRTFYNRDGAVIGSLDGEGFLHEIIYDRAGQVVEEVAYATQTNSAYWAAGGFSDLRASANPTSTANIRTRNIYDGQGLLRYTVDTSGRVDKFSYNSAQKLISTTSYAATISTSDFSYDNVKALVASIANAANDRTSTITYAASGLVSSTTDAGGLNTYFAYDNAGRVIKTVVGDGAAARTTRNYYSAGGDLRFTVDAEGYVRRYDYDAEGRKIRDVVWDTPIAVSDSTTIAQVNSLAAGNWADVNYAYDALGRVYSVYDGEGNRTVYTWYSNGTAAGIYHAHGTVDQSITYFGYDGAGRVITEYGALGESEQAYSTYTYDGLGNRLTATDANGKVTTFAYDELGQVLTATDAAGGVTTYEYNAFGQVSRVIDARGNSTYNYYNNLGQLWRTTDASGVNTDSLYTQFGELASVTRAGATTSFQYDKLGRVTRSTDALGFFETYTYDALGNRTSKTAKSATGTVTTGGTTTYTYDKRGLLLTETLPMASYDADGVLRSSTVTNKFEYDARGNRTKTIEAFGLAEARTTSFVYDKNNRLIETIGQTFLGMTPHEYIRYDARGNVTSTMDAAGARTIFYYDDLNRKTVEINALGTYTKYTYDKVGNVTEVRVYEAVSGVPADGGSEEEAPGVPGATARLTTFVYDNVNRMTSSSVLGVKTGVWNGSSWVADTSAITTNYQYDANGNVVKLTDGYGNATYSYYDALNRKTYQVDAENYLTYWAYDANGNVTWESRYANKLAGTPQIGVPPGLAGSPDDRHTAFTYDLVGNRTSETRHHVLVHNGSGAQAYASAIIYYSYNGLAQVVRKTEATGDFVDYAYDAAGRLTLETRKAYSDQTGASVTPTVDYYYNGVNNLSRTRQRGSGDSAERVTRYIYDGDKLRFLIDAEGNYRQYWYDQAGRQTIDYYSRIKSDGSTDTAYNGNFTSYDALGRVASKWQADYTGNTWTTKGPVTQLTYNSFGDVTGTSIGGIQQQQNQYDLAGRVTGTTSGDGLWKYFGYDKNGNQTVALASAGASLGGSFDAALGQVSSASVNATYTVYDKRNMAVTVFEEGRQFSAGGALQNLTTTRAYTAFGEVSSETNTLGAVLKYTYNTMGRMIRSESPSVEITLENGTAIWVKPSEDYYYDASGRLVATRDANGSYAAGGSAGAGMSKAADTGNLTRLTLLTGTGYGNSQALVTAETHADGGVKQTLYDIHGDARTLIDEIGRSASRTYDRMGRALTVGQIGGLVDYYSYDMLGQQLKHWNSYFGSYEVETTDYDIQGRVTTQRSFGGDTTSTSYSWDGSIAVAGVTLGGWLQTSYMANGLYAQEKTDIFGRVTWKQDLGGHTTAYTYDLGGRMASSSTNGMLVSFGWLNSGLQASVTIGTPGAGQANTNWSRKTANYTYDATGNRLTETLSDEYGYYTEGHWEYTQNPGGPPYYYEYPEYGYNEPIWVEESYYTYSVQIKNQSATYDALGRMKTWAEAGTGSSPASSTTTSYDANGNVRRTQALYNALDGNGASAGQATRDYWFRYDSMNRVVVNQGVLESGVITRGTAVVYGGGGGQDIMYDAAGQRTAVATTQAYYDGYGGYSGNEVRENYFYDAAGRLAYTYQATGAAFSGGYGGPVIPPPASGTGTLRSAYYYDGMGRMTSQTDYDVNGYTALYSRSAYYNTKGQLTSDYSWTKKTDNKTYASSNTYYFTDYNTYQYMLGSVGWMQSTSTVNGGSSVTSRTINGYVWWDGAVQSSISNKPNISQSTTYNTSFYLNSFGQLTGAYIADGKARSVSFTLDELGQIIRRDETRPYNAPSGQTGSPHEVWYRFGGRQLGYTGNNGTSEVSYQASIDERRIVQPTNAGTYRNGQLYGASYADFAQNYDPINSYYQGAAGGSYRVNQGDTLQSIAQSLWGDASLWYKIAEANGLGAQAGLIEGQTLILPTGVMRSKNNAATNNPYNPADAIGDLSPTQAQPPKKNKCGIFGQILLAVIAIAVTYFTAGTLTAAMGPILGGAMAGAAGSVVSQVVGVATGIQEKFSFKAVGLAALGGAVGGGLKELGRLGDLGKLGSFSKMGSFIGGSGFASTVTRAMTSSVLTQGIGVATGLQDKFSWAGVAAAGIGAAAGKLVGDAFTKTSYELDAAKNMVITSSISVGGKILSTMASNIAGAATSSAINGTSFGDELLLQLPNTIAGIIGNAIEGPSRSKQVLRRDSALSLAMGDGMGQIPTRSQLTASGITSTNADLMLSEYAKGTGTVFNSKTGKIEVDPVLSQFLTDNPITADDISTRERVIRYRLQAGDINAHYDFNADTKDPYSNSMVHLGDDYGAARTALRLEGAPITDDNIELVLDRGMRGLKPSKPKDMSGDDWGKIKGASGRIGDFSKYRSAFIAGYARSSLVVGRLTLFIGAHGRDLDSKGSLKYGTFATSVAEMWQANNRGYFTLRPFTSVSAVPKPGGAKETIWMRQYGVGTRSEIEIYKEAFGLKGGAFGHKLTHELVHATSWQHRVIGLAKKTPDINWQPGANSADVIYSRDPATHYALRAAYVGPGSSGTKISIPNTYTTNTNAVNNIYEDGAVDGYVDFLWDDLGL